jgi:hypothetical protein
MKRRSAAVGVTVLLFAARLDAHVPVAPLLDRASIVGVWEGIQPTEPRLFLLDIRTDGEPSFADMVVGAESDHPMVFQIDTVQTTRGKVLVLARGLNEDRDYRLKIVGSGRAFAGEGDMRADVMVTREARWPSHPTQIDFVLRKGSYAKLLGRMYGAGEKDLAEARKRLTGR